MAPLAVVAWAPVLLLSLEAWVVSRAPRWALAAAAASAAQWLAGYPQMAYLSALWCGAFALWSSARAKEHRAAAGVIGALAFAGVLAAAQLLPGLEAASESVRAAGLGPAEAARFALPPENLVTALSPWTLGGLGALPYYGRGYVWEHCLFFGRAALALCCAALAADKKTRPSAAAAALALLFAFGPLTPLFSLARAVLPGFSAVRGAAKALFLVPLFLCPLAARGFDLSRERSGARRLAWACAALAASCAVLLVALHAGPRAFARLLAFFGASGASEAPSELYASPSFAEAAARWAVRELSSSAGFFAAVCAVAVGASASARPALLAAGLAAELAVFAWAGRGSTPAETVYPEAWREASARLAPGERVFHDPQAFPNASLSTGAYDIWGYAALVPRRYAELVAGTQGLPPEQARHLMPIRRSHPVFDVMRLRLVFDPGEGLRIGRRKGELPAARLLGSWRAMTPREALTETLAPGFDASKEAIVEGALPFASKPLPKGGSAVLARQGPNDMTLDVDAPSDALVLVSESFSRGWKARADDGRALPVVPADYAFLGVVVPPGRGRVLLEYRPSSFSLGAVLTLLGALSWITLWIARPR